MTYAAVKASAQAGADLGAKINAADAIIGSSAGEILVDRDVSTAVSTPVVITNGHTLRFQQGGPYICTAGFTFQQGVSLYGHGGVTSYASGSTGTILVHNFNGDLITYSGASTDIGAQGGGTIENITLWNAYAGADLSGSAIKITGTGVNTRADWIRLVRVFVDGTDATKRWTHGLFIDGSPVGGTNGVRAMFIESCRFASCGTDKQDILLNNVYNSYLTNVLTNNSNNGSQVIGITITGTAGNVSSNINMTGCDFGDVYQDYANNVCMSGGALSNLTITNKAAGTSLYSGVRISGTVTNRAPANAVVQTYNLARDLKALINLGMPPEQAGILER